MAHRPHIKLSGCLPVIDRVHWCSICKGAAHNSLSLSFAVNGCCIQRPFPGTQRRQSVFGKVANVCHPCRFRAQHNVCAVDILNHCQVSQKV